MIELASVAKGGVVGAVAFGSARQSVQVITQTDPVTPDSLVEFGGSLVVAAAMIGLVFRLLAWSDKRAKAERDSQSRSLEKALDQVAKAREEAAILRAKVQENEQRIEALTERNMRLEVENDRLRNP